MALKQFDAPASALGGDHVAVTSTTGSAISGALRVTVDDSLVTNKVAFHTALMAVWRKVQMGSWPPA